MRLAHYINNEETERNPDNGLIKAKYIGAIKAIKGKNGKCYFSADDDKWYFSIDGKTDWYRVNLESLNFGA